MAIKIGLIQRVKSSVESLVGVDSKAGPRQITKLAKVLEDPSIQEVSASLKARADFQKWLTTLGSSRSGMGEGGLNWPDPVEENLGLSFSLIEYLAENPERGALGVAHSLFANRSLSADLSDLVRTIIVPFYQDFVEYIEDNNLIEREEPVSVARPTITNRVFLVHGRDGSTKNEVARLLEKLGLEVFILHERPNKGRTLITKFEEESADVTFAIVLVSPDDVGGLSDGEHRPRARQNVIFELGFFIGRLGSDRVCALISPSVERPSDYDGVAYVPLDEGGGWKADLVRELAAARVPVDFAKGFACPTSSSSAPATASARRRPSRCSPPGRGWSRRRPGWRPMRTSPAPTNWWNGPT